MSADEVAVGLGIVAIAGQVINYVLHLRVKTAILESEQKMLDKIDEDFVRKDTCEAEMRYQDERREREERRQRGRQEQRQPPAAPDDD